MLLDKNNPAEHNNAIMEFGALQCVPLSPDCAGCPLAEKCAAFSNGKVKNLPVKEKKNAVKERFFNYFFDKTAYSLSCTTQQALQISLDG